MVQARPFGTLAFDNKQHGWALNLGECLAEWLTCPLLRIWALPALNVRAQENHSRVAIQKILRELGFEIHIPIQDVREEGKVKVTHIAIISAIRDKVSSSHCACFHIGEAAMYFGIMHLVKENSIPTQELEKLSRTAILNLYQDCIEFWPDGFYEDVIYEQLKRTGGNQFRVREVLDNMNKPLVILLILADPCDASKTSFLAEARRLKKGIKMGRHHDSFEVEMLEEVRFDNFGHDLAHYKPTIVHFAGHGKENGPVFKNMLGNEIGVAESALIDTLHNSMQHNLQGIVFDACFTAETFSKVPNCDLDTIVISGRSSDAAAVSFSQHFYRYLSSGLPFKDAFNWAKSSHALEGATSVKATLIEPREMPAHATNRQLRALSRVLPQVPSKSSSAATPTAQSDVVEQTTSTAMELTRNYGHIQASAS